MSPSILIFGFDDRLLNSRRWVLEDNGFQVKTTSELVEVARLITAQSIELLILCQTLHNDTRQNVLELAHSIQPRMKILILDHDDWRGVPTNGVSVLSGFLRPKVLIAMVMKITQPEIAPPEDVVSSAI